MMLTLVQYRRNETLPTHQIADLPVPITSVLSKLVEITVLLLEGKAWNPPNDHARKSSDENIFFLPKCVTLHSEDFHQFTIL